MSDKTRLELDIEQQERYRTPVGVKILIAVLIIALFAVGVYTLNIRQELSKKEREIISFKENLRKEKVELLSRIKRLETKPPSSEYK